MKAETARLVADELEKAFANIGVSFERGIRELWAMTVRDLEIWKMAGDKTKTQNALREYLPEPTSLSLDARIAVIRQLPDLLRSRYEGSTRPKRGRRREMNLSQARLICEEIGRLTGVDGLVLKDALLRMAQRHGVSVRTVQRIWYGRNKPESPFNLQQPKVQDEDMHFTVTVMRPDPSIESILKRHDNEESQKNKKRK